MDAQIEPSQFSIEGFVSQAWTVFKKYWATWVGVIVLYFIVYFALVVFTSIFLSLFGIHNQFPFSGVFGALMQLVILAFAIYMQAFWIKAALANIEGKGITTELAKSIKLVTLVRLFFGTILFSLAMLLGFFLLIVPGFYIAFTYQYFTYFLVDRECTLIEAFELSGKATPGFRIQLFLLGIVMVLIVVVGAILLGVGLLAAIPLVILTQAVTFRFLDENMRRNTFSSSPESTLALPAEEEATVS